MKNLIIAGLVAFASNAALAEPFEFQKRIGGPEYDFSDGTEHMSFAPVVASGSTPSLTVWMHEADVDGTAANDFRGRVVESGPSRISLYEIQRDSPEGIAYSDYHERYAVDTDWDAVAREFRQDRINRGMASGTGSVQGES